MKDRYIKPMLEIAKIVASLSYAEKKKVGTVILRDNRIIATGYNGTVANTDNCCEKTIMKVNTYYDCDSCNENSIELEVGELGDKCEYCNGTIIEKFDTVEKIITSEFVLHSEENAILQCAENGISIKGTTLICTDSPCEKCSRMIAQVGISEVYYERLHDKGEGIKFLQEKTNVKVYKIEE